MSQTPEDIRAAKISGQRKLYGISYAELARASGVSVQRVTSFLKRTNRRRMSYNEVALISQALNAAVEVRRKVYADE